MIFSLVSEVEFAAIVDKSYGIDRAESNPLARFERRTAARFEMKSGNSSRAGSALDKRVLGLSFHCSQGSECLSSLFFSFYYWLRREDPNKRPVFIHRFTRVKQRKRYERN